MDLGQRRGKIGPSRFIAIDRAANPGQHAVRGGAHLADFIVAQALYLLDGHLDAHRQVVGGEGGEAGLESRDALLGDRLERRVDDPGLVDHLFRHQEGHERGDRRRQGEAREQEGRDVASGGAGDHDRQGGEEGNVAESDGNYADELEPERATHGNHLPRRGRHQTRSRRSDWHNTDTAVTQATGCAPTRTAVPAA